MPRVEASVRRRQFIEAARETLSDQGVAQTSLRNVAARAGVPLGTMQYVFPTKEQLLRAVIEDIVEEIAQLLEELATFDDGIEHALRAGLEGFWSALVTDRPGLQLVQYELVSYALRTPGHEDLARWQYDRYAAVVTDWCARAAELSGETTRIPLDSVGRLVVAGIDGLILQSVSFPDAQRSQRDLQMFLDMVVGTLGIEQA